MSKRHDGRKVAMQGAVRSRRRRTGRQSGGLPKWAWWPLGGLTLMALLLAAAVGTGYGIYRSFADDLVEPEAILETQRALGTSKVFDRDGEDGSSLYEFADPLSGLLKPVQIHEVSQYLIDATVATEDASYFDNSGINTRGLVRAAWENLGFGSGGFFGGSGGSSITQQLVKNVLIPPEERSGRGLDRVRGKLKESILAVELTTKYSKGQIMEWYLNTIFYGNLAYGIGAASERYFGKPASELTLPEAALLAGIPQAPAIFDPFTNPIVTKEKQALVLDLMARESYITQAEADSAKQTPLRFATRAFKIEAPHFVLYVQEQVKGLCERGRIPIPDTVEGCNDLLVEGGLRITTTLDLDLQRTAEEILETDLASFEEGTGAHNASLVSIDPKTGEILAMVGSRDFFREDIDGQVNLATAPNSPGSSIKPITYIAAFVQDPMQWNPATILWDVPVTFEEFDGTRFSPENFDGVERGPVTIRSALANSINIPAFRVADTLGTTAVLEVAHRMGITTMRDPDNYGPSITLGGGDVTLLDMVYAYSTFANLGIMRGQRTTLDLPPGYRELDPIAILEITDSSGRLLYHADLPEERRVLPAPQAYQITSILSDNDARSILYGLNSTLVLDRSAAAKTGTAGEPDRNDDRRDYWTVGYTPDLVTGVWVGNADNTPMTGGSSSRTAGLIWHDFMLAAHEGIEPSKFQQPQGLTTEDVYIPRLRVIGPGEDRKTVALQNPCSNVSRELFIAENGVPDKENNICFEVEIDARTLLLASPSTPEEFVAEDFFLLPPLAEDSEDPDEEIIKWLRANKVRYVGDDLSSDDAIPANIDSPSNGADLGRGFALIRGRAASEELEQWTLSYAFGTDPTDEEFVVLFRSETPIVSGQLARWNTQDLEPGAYVLRLVVDDGFLGKIVVETHVTVAQNELLLEEAPEEADAPQP